jgi:hypothetical protein
VFDVGDPFQVGCIVQQYGKSISFEKEGPCFEIAPVLYIGRPLAPVFDKRKLCLTAIGI